MKIRESCLQNGIFIYKAGISLTKQDFKLQNRSFGIQTGLSACNLPWLFEKKKAEVLFAVKDGEEIGFALFFHNFSTFLGRAGIYLEDLYVKPEYRGNGYGKALLQELARIALERGCGRLEWWCLDWNQPSIDFYLAMGAEPMKDWTVYRVAGEALEKLGGRKTESV